MLSKAVLRAPSVRARRRVRLHSRRLVPLQTPARIALQTALLISVFSSLLFASPQESFENGLQLRDAGRYEEAESQFKRALEENPSNADYHFELANLYGIEHDVALKEKENERSWQYMESAARELEQAVMIRQDFLAAHFNLGVVYKRIEEYEKARAEFRKALQIDPNSVQALLQVGQTYEEQGFLDEAESIYQDAKEKFYPNDDAVYALENIRRRRYQAGMREHSSMNQSLGMMQQKLSNAYAEKNDPSLANAYGSSYGPSASGGSAVSSLGSMLMQQFMNSRSQRSSQTQSDWQ